MVDRFPMKEIALQAGVSLATVDRVLNERPGVRATTHRRVHQAWAELQRQQEQVGLKGRRVLIDLVMEAPLRFSRMVCGALDAAMRRAQPAVFRAREHIAESMDLAELLGVLDAIARRGSHGVLLKAPDAPAVTEAVQRLRAKGIPVVTLVTDLHEAPRLAYVGLDNRCAGQTAAYLVQQWLAGTPAHVLVSSSGQQFLGEGERIAAFREALTAAQPECKVHVLHSGRGLHAPTASAVGRLLARQPGLSAVYSVGGANAAILEAFDKAQRGCRVFIGHDLDDDNLALLRAGRLSAVLHHDLQHDLHMACLLLLQAPASGAGLASAPAPIHSNVEVITPFNVPAAFTS
jgi:LacI family transcriptional regulator